MHAAAARPRSGSGRAPATPLAITSAATPLVCAADIEVPTSGRIANSLVGAGAVHRKAGVGELQDRDRVVGAAGRAAAGRGGAAARGDQVGALAVVGVGGEAAVLGRRGDRERVRGGAGEQRPVLPVPRERVAGGGDDERPELVGLADRRADGRHLRGSWSRSGRS